MALAGEQAVDLVHGLVRIPSLSRQEHAAASWLAEWMGRHGYERAFVDEVGNAVGEIGHPDARATIVLLGHIDTVPGDIPVRIESTPDGDVLYGRGSVDAKGPLATFAAVGAKLGPVWARRAGVRVVVVGAVEEEAATSKGARHVAARFDGVREPIPTACVIGEPSSWRRVTLGYKGRLLLEVHASQPMAHTAGPDASVATAVVDLWNWVTRHASRVNAGRDKAFDQLSPSLRRFNTSTSADIHEHAEAQLAWRLPVGFDAHAFAGELVAALQAGLATAGEGPADADVRLTLAHGAQTSERVVECGKTRFELAFRGYEAPWRGDRNNALVRAFLAGIRSVDPAVQPGFVLKTGTSDMNVVAPLWQCPIVAYGPGDSALDHTPHEHLPLDEYWQAVCALEATLMRLADSQ